MPAYRSLDARFTGVVADATRHADELYHDGDLTGAMATLEGALAQSITIPPRFPPWAVMRLAFVYRRLKRFQDETELLERSLPHQIDEAARRRLLLRLEKARTMVARATPRQPMVLVPPLGARSGEDGAPGESSTRSERATRTDSRLRRNVGPEATVEALHAATHHVGVEFLRAELEIANIMLELAAASTDETSRTRRYERASEAAAEVMTHLIAEGSPIHWTDAEHEELSRALWALIRRIRTASAAGGALDDMFTTLPPPPPPKKPGRRPERGGSSNSHHS